jgi:hypothetical protein
MAELADAPDSKSGSFGSEGSTPSLGTTQAMHDRWKPFGAGFFDSLNVADSIILTQVPITDRRCLTVRPKTL